MAPTSDAARLISRLSLNAVQRGGSVSVVAVSGPTKTVLLRTARRGLATKKKANDAPATATAPDDPTLILANQLIAGELDRVKADISDIDARLKDGATPNSEKLSLLRQRKAKEAELVFGDINAHRQVTRLGNSPLNTGLSAEEEARLLPIRHDHFVKRRVPVLLDHAKRDGTLMDIYGHLDALEPVAEVTIHLPAEGTTPKGTAWKGEPMAVRKAAPTVRIESWDPEEVDDGKERFLTVLVMDLDYPQLDTSSYEACLLSLHTNIPKSPIVNLDLSLPGVLPYLPPHPAKQNPNLWRRIVVMVCEQGGGKINVEIPAVSPDASLEARSPWVRDEIGEAERKHMIKERVAMLPFLKMMRKYELEPVGMGYWKCEWAPASSEIYKELGLHEPVLAQMPADLPTFARQIGAIPTPTHLLQLAQLKSPSGSKRLTNYQPGEVLPEPSSLPARMPTLADETIAKLEEAARLAADKKSEKAKAGGGKGKPSSSSVTATEVKPVTWGVRTSRPTPVDVAKEVREREGKKGPVTEFLEKAGREKGRGRYQSL